MLRCFWTHSGSLPECNKFFDWIKEALNLQEGLLTGTLLRRTTVLLEQFYSALIWKHSLIKLGPLHLQLTFASCFLLKLALGTSLLNICFCSCLHGSSGRFYKWNSSFSWGLQGHSLWGLFFCCSMCWREVCFSLSFLIKLQIWRCCRRVHAMSESRWWDTRFSGGSSALSQPKGNLGVMAEEFARRYCASAELFVFILVGIF